MYLSDNNEYLLCKFIDGIVDEARSEEHEYAKEKLRLLLEIKHYPNDEIEEMIKKFGELLH